MVTIVNKKLFRIGTMVDEAKDPSLTKYMSIAVVCKEIYILELS